MKLTGASMRAAQNNDLENFIVASTPGGIEAQEAAGQKSFVAVQTLPKECPREDLEKLGFVFGDDVDDIFINVEFPKGWSKKATDHSMWSDLLDEKGRRRGGIFYKAAFYDRSSHMRLNCRFSIDFNYELKDAVQHHVKDCDEIVFNTEKVDCEHYSDAYWKAEDDSKESAENYLNGKYPNWKDCTEYWV